MKTLIAALVATTFSIGAFAAASAPMGTPMAAPMAASAPMMKASAPMMKASGAMKMKKMKKAASAPA